MGGAVFKLRTPTLKYMPLYIGKVLHTNIQNINYCLLAYLEMYSVYGIAVQQVTVMHSSSINIYF